MSKRVSRAKQSAIAGKQRDKKKAELSKHFQAMEKIKASPNTVQIRYPTHKEAFDYVDNLFPGSEVKDVVIYRVSPRYLERLGYGGAGGFYCRYSKIIVIASYSPKAKRRYIQSRYDFSIRGEMTKDEVIAHELCHYCFVEEGGFSNSKEINEEFAYGWSIGYLRSRGRTDDFIITKNFFPFLVEIMSPKAMKYVLNLGGITQEQYNKYSDFNKREFGKKYGIKWHEKRKELAYQRGLKIIELYDKKALEGTHCTKKVIKTDRFDLMDLDWD
jgi:hypothetical protein